MAERLESFAHLVEQEQADVVLLQEVSRTRELRADEWLAERLGMAYAYSRVNGHEVAAGFEEGLAVLSRFPVEGPRIQQLDPKSTAFVRRQALGATVRTPFGDLLSISAHLGLGRKRNSQQFAKLQSWVAEISAGRPVIIGGDFNVHEGAPRMKQRSNDWLDLFRHVNPTGDGTTFELTWPWGKPMWRSRLDYLFLRSGSVRWHVLDARHLDAPKLTHSDHRAVVARLVPKGRFF